MKSLDTQITPKTESILDATGDGPWRLVFVGGVIRIMVPGKEYTFYTNHLDFDLTKHDVR